MSADELLAEVRRTIVIAVAADDVLSEHLVLKGGNALEIAWGLSSRASLDLDYSIDGEGLPEEELSNRLFRSLKDRFALLKLVVVDEQFVSKPRIAGEGIPTLGYAATFKLVSRDVYDNYVKDPKRLRDRAVRITGKPDGSATFSIEISKNEYCKDKTMVSVEQFGVSVYSFRLIVLEKFRALCQQIPELKLRVNPTQRARDFYDIYAVSSHEPMDLTAPDSLQIIKHVFEAKKVPLDALAMLRDQRDFHRAGWPSVVLTARGKLKEYDEYFDYVIEMASSILEALRKIDHPI
jgi:predicted nucleotidyltransferase component of viral defense system